MRLTEQQRIKVEENLGLVGKVLRDRVHGPGGGSYTYNDLFQIGCIGLCKAAATDSGGCFSTYAYRLIWNEICSALRKAGSQRVHECDTGEVPRAAARHGPDPELRVALADMLQRACNGTNDTVRKGIDSMKLMAAGFTCREIGEREGIPANVVSARVSRARKYLLRTGVLQDLLTYRRRA